MHAVHRSAIEIAVAETSTIKKGILHRCEAARNSTGPR